MKHFPSAGQHTKCLTHFIEEDTEAHRGLSNFLKTTELEVSCWYSNSGFFASGASTLTACEMTFLFGASFVFKHFQWLRQQAFRSPGETWSMQILPQKFWAGAQESAFLTHAQMRVMLLVWAPHFVQWGFRQQMDGLLSKAWPEVAVQPVSCSVEQEGARGDVQ